MSNDKNLNQLNAMMQKEMPKRSFVFVDYSQLDSALTKDKHKSFGAICMMDSLTYWETLDDDAYREQKKALIAVMLKKLERSYPNISELVEYAEVGTAKTVKRYIKTPNGTAYGFKPTPKAFFRIPKVKSSKMKNLYFVGQWVIAGGFSPTIVSGGICYEKIRKELK